MSKGTSIFAPSGKLAALSRPVFSMKSSPPGVIYAPHAAFLKVSLSGTWVYRFTRSELVRLKALIAGKSRAEAETLLAKAQGVRAASIRVQRLDFKDLLPADPAHIHLLVLV
jgi:hypothetical protein